MGKEEKVTFIKTITSFYFETWSKLKKRKLKLEEKTFAMN